MNPLAIKTPTYPKVGGSFGSEAGKLLIESTGLFRLDESSPQSDPYTFRGTFTVFDIANENGRRYPRSIFSPEIGAIQNQVKTNRLLGELDHPKTYNEVRFERVSHLITSLEESGDKVIGSLRLLPTPSGKLMMALVDAGVPVQVSSRGLGDTVNLSDGTEKVTKYKLITYDIVSTPSYGDSVVLNNVVQFQQVKSKLEAVRESLGEKYKGLKPLVESALQRVVFQPERLIIESKEDINEEDSMDQVYQESLRLSVSESIKAKRLLNAYRSKSVKHFREITQPDQEEKGISEKCSGKGMSEAIDFSGFVNEIRLLTEEVSAKRQESKTLQEEIKRLAKEVVTQKDGRETLKALIEDYKVNDKKLRTTVDEMVAKCREARELTESQQKEILGLNIRLYCESRGISPETFDGMSFKNVEEFHGFVSSRKEKRGRLTESEVFLNFNRSDGKASRLFESASDDKSKKLSRLISRVRS